MRFAGHCLFEYRAGKRSHSAKAGAILEAEFFSHLRAIYDGLPKK